MPNFKFFFNNQAQTLDVILHGGSYSMDSPFICKVIDHSRGFSHSVVAFNFPYLDRGEKHSSGPELPEEIQTLKDILIFCHANDYQTIRLIGKSLGSIVSGFFLKKLSRAKSGKFSVVVLGYVLGDVDLKTFPGKITIIQGAKDKFGNIEAVKHDLANAVSEKISYFEVPNADHSYRDPQTKEPVYEDNAVALVPSD